MLDDDSVDQLINTLCDLYTPEELIEILGVSVEQVCERFRDEILEFDWGDGYL